MSAQRMLEAALAFAAAGRRVFPLPPRQKRASMEKWQERATTDQKQIETWFAENSDDMLSAVPNIGLPTGNGLVVLDEDPRHGSELAIGELEVENGKLPDTLTVRTPSGGRHRFFSVPDGLHIPNSAGKLGKGLDIRGDGGYVAAAPSVTEQGAYIEENPGAAIVPAPEWLLTLTTKPRDPKEPSAAGASQGEPLTHNFTREQAKEILSHIKVAKGDYDTWTAALWAHRRMTLAAQDGSSPEDWFRDVDEWSRHQEEYRGSADVRAKWLEADKREFGYGTKTLIDLAGWQPPAISSVEAFKPVPENAAPAVDCMPADLPQLIIQKLPPTLTEREPAPRRWILGSYLPAETATLLVALGGLGKSYLTLYLAVCVALGLNFCGQPCERGRVVILSGEDDFLEVQRRLYFIMQALCLTLPPRGMELLHENLDVVDIRQYRKARGSAVLTRSEHGGVKLTPFAGQVAKGIGTANLVVFDTVSRFNGAEENSNDAAARLVDAFEMVAEWTHSSVLALAHTGLKGQGGAADQYASRGATALSDNSRSVMVLAPLPPQTIEKIADESQSLKALRNDLLRLCHAKSNYARRADDVYFERYDGGVLIPTKLMMQGEGPEATSVVVARLLEGIGTTSVTRNQVRDNFKSYVVGARREVVEQAFNAAIAQGLLVSVGTYHGSEKYQVRRLAAPAANDPTAGNADMV